MTPIQPLDAPHCASIAYRECSLYLVHQRTPTQSARTRCRCHHKWRARRGARLHRSTHVTQATTPPFLGAVGQPEAVLHSQTPLTATGSQPHPAPNAVSICAASEEGMPPRGHPRIAGGTERLTGVRLVERGPVEAPWCLHHRSASVGLKFEKGAPENAKYAAPAGRWRPVGGHWRTKAHGCAPSNLSHRLGGFVWL